MARRRAAPEAGRAPAPAALYAPVLQAGAQALTARVHEMHHAIAGKTFDVLDQVPGLSLPAGVVRKVHDTFTTGAYAAVQLGTGALLGWAGTAERLIGVAQPSDSGPRRLVRNALNAASGDALQRTGNPLAMQMGLHADGEPLRLTRTGLAVLGESVCLFIHGLGCDERSWAFHPQRWHGAPEARHGADYGVLLARELGYSAVHLRYNTGLPIADNARQLAALLAKLVAAAPQVRHLVLVGHSMGGLVARLACEPAGDTPAHWRSKLRMVVCLGSPHRGAPLEQLGHVATWGLGLADVTRPLATLGNARSQGIKDLRRGLRGHQALVPAPALRLVMGRLASERPGAVGTLVDAVLGDGLVRPGSAGDAALQGDVERVELARVGHMALLNHPRVYALLKAWLAPWATAAAATG